MCLETFEVLLNSSVRLRVYPRQCSHYVPRLMYLMFVPEPHPLLHTLNEAIKGIIFLLLPGFILLKTLFFPPERRPHCDGYVDGLSNLEQFVSTY